MDLREIQRLHAQFAPDSMTIDLPRQIAALPAPAAFESDSKSSTLTSCITKTGPVLRSCAKPLLIAVVVAMAGVGAARIWHSVGAGTVSQRKDAAKTQKAQSDNAAQPPVAVSEPTVRPIDASPARPVALLSASDLGNAPTVGLTADQFRNSMSLASTGNFGNAGVAKATSPVSNETKLAAASPIRQSHREPDAARAVAAPQPQVVQGDSKPLATPVVHPTPPAQATTSAAPAAAARAAAPAAAPAADRGASSPATTARTHSYRHHAARSRDEQASESDTAPNGSNKKPAPASRAGSNEVQMF